MNDDEKIYYDIGEFHTDKKAHGYMPFYLPLFKEFKNIKKVLEIGVAYCQSLKMLSYFFPEAIVHGIDVGDKKEYDTDKIKTFVIYQENITEMEQFISENGTFDLIIDDGGHTMKQQQTTFGILFKYLNPGGAYIIEDLHTSRMDDPLFHNSEDQITTLDMLELFKKENKIVSNYISDGDKDFITHNTKSLEIWSRTPEYDKSVTSIIRRK